MSKCDDIYNRIQDLQQRQKRLAQDQAFVFSAGQKRDPSRRFVTRDVNGEEIEVDFDDLWKSIEADSGLLEWAQNKAEEMAKPVGRKGQFENFGVLVDRLGFDDAAQAGAFMQKLTGNWAKADPADYAFVTGVNGKDQWAARVQGAFKEAGLDADDKIVQAISVNAAPFLDILSKQAKLEVFDWTTKNALRKSIDRIQQAISETGVPPGRSFKEDFISNYRKAMYAHRSARLAKRRSGQLLQNYQRHVEGEITLGADGTPVWTMLGQQNLEDVLSTPESRKRLTEMMEQTGIESVEELKTMTREVIGATTEEMVQEGSLVKKVIDAANKGAEGLDELEDIKQTLKKESVDPAGDNEYDAGWESTWRRNAKAAYKDTILFSPRSQTMMNYLSQKIVFITEGYRTMAGGGWNLYAKRNPVFEVVENADGQLEQVLVDKVKIQPLATSFYRDVLKANLDNARIAANSALIAEDAIKQTWSQTISRSFFGDENQFAGNVDAFTGEGLLSIEDQYRVAQEVMDEKWDWNNKLRWPMQLRNKLHTALKLWSNQKVWNNVGPLKKTGARLPVYSSLQMMTAVDQRAGERNFFTIRGYQDTMDAAAANPGGTMDEWKAQAIENFNNALYSDPPTKAQIEAAREDFNLSKEDLTDEEVDEYIVGTRLGMPVGVRSNPKVIAALNKATEMRMQGDVKAPEGLEALDPIIKGIDRQISTARRSDWGDSLISFWRSPVNQQLWDLALATDPGLGVYRTLKVAGYMVQGKPVPTQLLVKAQASMVMGLSMISMYAALKSQGLVVGGGPLESNAREQWKDRLAQEGKVPNSIFGVPFSMAGLPVLNTLFLYDDLWEVINQGGVSEWDQQNATWDIVSVLAGMILRTPGLATVGNLFNVFTASGPAIGTKLAQATAFWANGNFNVGSGGGRLAEWATGNMASDAMPPVRRTSGEDRFDLSELDEGHPLRSTFNKLRDWTYYSNPGMSGWLGTQKREQTSLGEPIRRPYGIFRGEWPVGVPGVWEFNKGNDVVETEMQQLGMLDPAASVQSGEVAGIPIIEAGRTEINNTMGTIKAPDEVGSFREYSRLHPSGEVIYRGPQVEEPRSEVLPGYLPEKDEGATQPVGELLDRVTRGATYREALNNLFKSPEYQNWKAQPETTWDPAIRDLPPRRRRQQIGPFLIQTIKKHYEDLAIQKFEVSNSEAASLWRQDQENARITEESADTLQNALDRQFAPVAP